MLQFISISSAFLPIVFFVFFCLKRSHRELWVIFFYTLISFSIDFIQSVTLWGRENNFELFGILTIVEYTLFTYFFYLIIKRRLIKKIIAVCSLCTIFFLITIFLKSEKTNFDSISASIESVTIIILSIIYFFEQISEPQEHFIYSSANFWIVLAIMIYLSGTLFLFIMARNLSSTEIRKYWAINNISNIITNIIFCIAFLVNRFASPNPSAEKSYLDYNNIPENP